MAATIGTQSQEAVTGVNNRTFTHTVDANCELLVVRYAIHCTTSNDPQGVSATYNGVAMTSIVDYFASNRNTHVGVLGLVHPAKGANSMVVTWARLDIDGVIEASNIIGASKLPINGNSTSSSSGTASLAITGLGGYMVLDVLEGDELYVWTSQTTLDFSRVVTSMTGYGSHGQAAGTSTTMSYTTTASRPWCMAGCALEPDMAGAPSGMTPFMCH